MKWLLQLLTENKDLPKAVRIMACVSYALWAAGTAFALLGWAINFSKGASTLGELADLLLKLF